MGSEKLAVAEAMARRSCAGTGFMAGQFRRLLVRMADGRVLPMANRFNNVANGRDAWGQKIRMKSYASRLIFLFRDGYSC
jgi:hypothetical protein